MLMVQALNNLPKGSLPNNLYELESVSYVVAFLHSIIALLVIISIINKSLLVRGFEFELILAEEEDLLVLIHFSDFLTCKILLQYFLVLLYLARL